MIEIVIGENQAGQRFDKYLGKLLPKAPESFYYKMLRKKNITLNGKKAVGRERLEIGDCVRLFLAEETFQKFSAGDTFFKDKESKSRSTAYSEHGVPKEKWKLPGELTIVYEDEQILLWNKPVNMLSQKAKATDISLNEYFLAYLADSGQLKADEFSTFKPSICNRLDRNTSGIVICGKTLQGLQKMNDLLKTRELEKYYLCVVKGQFTEPLSLEGYLRKASAANKVQLSKKKTEDSSYVKTEIKPISGFVLPRNEKKEGGQPCTLAEVHLITGKTHQIRAHMASIGHPILCDYKYGDKRLNDEIKAAWGISEQLLHAYRLVFPELTGAFAQLSKKNFQTALPPRFCKLGINEVSKWQLGIQED